MAIKIIHILHHSPSWITRNIEEDIFDGWHVRTAKAIQDLAIKDCKIECWLPEKTKSKERQIEKDAITYRIFPSFPINYGREISLPLIKALKKELSNPILLHLHGIFNYTTYLIATLFGYIPIVAQHHGDCPPLNLLQRRTLLYAILPLLEIEHLFFCKTLNNIDYFFCSTTDAQKSLKHLGIKNKSSIQSMGVDFDKFNLMSKTEAKEKLRLPMNSKIILYVGKLNRYKGGDKVINVYKKFKDKNVKLIIVGASESDAFYKDAIENQAMIFSRLSNEELKLFYQAADVFVLLSSGWGGIGVSTIESLACGTPVVTGTLQHFPHNHQNLGILATDTDQIFNGIEYIFNHQDKFNNCREIAQKYYDWKQIANNTFCIYRKLFLQYYNIKLEKSDGK